MSNIADIYSLTPIQEGIYFQSRLNASGKAYHLQFLLGTESGINAKILKQAILLLSLRHDVLRSAFAVSKSTGAVKQIILKNRDPEFAELTFDAAHNEEKLKELTQKDADRPFDLEKDPLFRATLVSFSDSQYLIISTHHIIVDGWSLPVLAGDIEYFCQRLSSGDDYEQLKQKTIDEKASSVSFGTYTEWLKKQNNDETVSYWKDLLSGYNRTQDPAIDTLKSYNSWFDSETVSFGSDLTKQAELFAKANSISVNTLFETALGIVLLRQSETNDIVFGKVISGRSTGMEKIHSMAGTFINTIPVRVKTDEDSDINTLLKYLQKQSSLSDKFGFLSLNEICRHTDIRRSSLKLLFVFENYPFGSDAGNSAFRLLQSKDQTDLDLTIKVFEGNNGYYAEASFSPFYRRVQITDLLEKFKETLENIIDSKLENLPHSSNRGTVCNNIRKKDQSTDPNTETEKEICSKFAELLHVSNIGMNTDFLECGGSSIDMISFLSDEPFSSISVAEFISDPTPAGVLALLRSKKEAEFSFLQPLVRTRSKQALVLFPYAGGSAESYAELVRELKKKAPALSIYFIRFFHSAEECKNAAKEIEELGKYCEISFYSHCVGSSVAMQIIRSCSKDLIKRMIAGAHIPFERPLKYNWWHFVPDAILAHLLIKAGSTINKLERGKRKGMLKNFRNDTDFSTLYFKSEPHKIPASLTVIINKNDPFTSNWKDTEKNWQRYAENHVSVRYIESDSHYFQSKNADELAEIIKEIISETSVLS